MGERDMVLLGDGFHYVIIVAATMVLTAKC